MGTSFSRARRESMPRLPHQAEILELQVRVPGSRKHHLPAGVRRLVDGEDNIDWLASGVAVNRRRPIFPDGAHQIGDLPGMSAWYRKGPRDFLVADGSVAM